MSQIDILIEYEEDKIFEELKEKKKYSPGKGDYLVKHEDRKMTQEEIDTAFEQLDISHLNLDKDARR